MKNYTDSDYALNRYSNNIVYRFADGIIEVTLEDYLRENPDKTEADFLEMKALSDKMLLDEDRADYRHTYRNVSIHSLNATEACCVPSPEENLILQSEQAATKKYRCDLATKSLDKLTETQRRRYLMHHADGLSTRKIVEREGVTQHAVMDSISRAERKIKKFLKDN